MAEITHLMDEKKRAVPGYQRTLEILDQGELSELGTKYFPLVFNARQFLDVCRHKLAVLKKGLKQQ
jgi:chemotaxis protein methyltransferase CheR